MKVAIAGTSQVATYLVSALTSSGHDVVMLTRREPPTTTATTTTPLAVVPHRITDYTVASLVAALHDREALISTVVSYTDLTTMTPTHVAMLAAVIESATCKTFIPSEWTCDALNHPDQPMFMRPHTAALHAALRDAHRDHAIRYTIVCNSWFMDYVVPEKNRGLRDVGALWPMDHATARFTIYGSGEMRVSLVSVRDVACAVARLLDVVVDEDQQQQQQQEETGLARKRGTVEWEEYTFVQGDSMTWNQLFDVVNERASSAAAAAATAAAVPGGSSSSSSNEENKNKNKTAWTKVTQPLSETVDQLVTAEKDGNSEAIMLAQFELLSYSGASLLPRDKVESQRKKFFDGLNFRTVKEVLDAVEADGDVVI